MKKAVPPGLDTLAKRGTWKQDLHITLRLGLQGQDPTFIFNTLTGV